MPAVDEPVTAGTAFGGPAVTKDQAAACADEPVAG